MLHFSNLLSLILVICCIVNLFRNQDLHKLTKTDIFTIITNLIILNCLYRYILWGEQSQRFKLFKGNKCIVTIIILILGRFFYEFYFYWYHRLSHRFSYFHTYHHSSPVYDDHSLALLIANPVSYFGYYIPILLIIFFPYHGKIMASFVLMNGIHGIFYHDNIHHIGHHRDQTINFGITPIVDKLFGTHGNRCK